MAQTVLLVRGELRQGAVGTADDEQRIVAEPSRAPRRTDDRSLADARDRMGFAAIGERIHEGEDAAKAGASPRGSLPCEPRSQNPFGHAGRTAGKLTRQG